ncbi:putative NACHT domain-containing protein [Seiridium cardinale]
MQLASNFVSFFEQLTTLLDMLSNSFSQYELIFELCSSDIHLRRSEIPSILETVYLNILQIFAAIIRVFTKRDGRLRNTAVVIGELLWKPFNIRFRGFLETLVSHRKRLFREVNIWHVNSSAKERARDAAARNTSQLHYDFSISEASQMQKERELSQRERELMVLEREQANADREQTRESLAGIRNALQNIEREILEINHDRIRKWVSPPNFIDAKESAAKLRHRETAAWIFREPKYQQWLSHDLEGHDGLRKLGSNVLWIYGNPGSGKTVLASSIIDDLKSSNSFRNEIYYFFFEYKSPLHNSARSAYRSILAQILTKHWKDQEVLDRFAFIMYDNTKNQNQLYSSEFILLELIQLLLSRDSVLIIDGIDECEESESFVRSLTKIWESRSPYILVLSRVYVNGLRQCIPESNRLGITKDLVSPDIRTFSAHELQRLFDEEIIPGQARSRKGEFEDRMETGADGMFLWARLMINFIRSPFIPPNQRLHILSQINTPEGLEVMYGRIVALIKGSGNYCETMASTVLTRLIYATAPISSRQIHQSLVVDKVLSADVVSDPESLRQFEDSAIMACTGLVERVVLHQCPNFLYEESSLQLIHLSANEILIEKYSASYLAAQAPIPKLIPDRAIASLDYTTNCLKQILFHTPAQPLSGELARDVNDAYLYKTFCFSDYAAVSWPISLHNFVDTVSSNYMYLTYRELSSSFLESLLYFIPTLETFLRIPRSLSVWLEITYTTGYYEIDPEKYGHPSTNALEALTHWAKSMRITDARWPISDELITKIEAFGAELRDVISTWGSSLRQKPHIVWDELTGFLKQNQFFWSSGSTTVSYQQPVVPMGSVQLQSPAALLSRTSKSGDMKAVLSVWANA